MESDIIIKFFSSIVKMATSPIVKETKQPPEHVKYRLTVCGTRYELEFEKHTDFVKPVGVDALRGYIYFLNGRLYSDISTFRKKTLEELSEDVRIMEDAYRSRVLYVYDSIPTFDSGDRVWDSAKHDYLMFDGKNINLVMCRRGYKISRLEVYGKLLSAPEGMKQYFDKLQFPTDSILWK